MVRSLDGKEVVEGIRTAVIAIADDLTIDVPDPEGSANQSELTVIIGSHAVIDMGHRHCPVGNPQHRLFIGGSGVAH